MNTRTGKPLVVFALLMLVSLSACGMNSASTNLSSNVSRGAFSNKPLGSGTDEEPGTDGKPRPTLTGHTESIIPTSELAFVGSDNGTLYAIESRDGKVQWQFKAGPAVSLFSVVNGVVFATADSIVYALDTHTGRILWQYQANTFLSQVLVYDGIVYANSAAQGNASTIYALQAMNGSMRWQYSTTSATPALLGIINGVVYVLQTAGEISSSNFSQSLYALRASDAQVLWHASLAGSDGLVDGAPTGAGGLVYIATTHGAIYAFHADTGVQAWHVAQPSNQNFITGFVSPVVANGLLYISNRGGIAAYRLVDGAQQWQYKREFLGPLNNQPVVAGGLIYFNDPSHGSIVALRATDGTQHWQQKTVTSGSRSLTVEDGFVIDVSGPVYALHTSDGTQAWEQDFQGSGEGSSAAPPETVGEGIVYIGSDSGIVQALAVNNGKLLWQYKIQEKAIPTEPVYEAAINFAASVSYAQALEIITNLGLKTAVQCHPQSWIAGDEKDLFANDNHLLTVAAAINSAPLWLNRLTVMPGVERAEAIGVHGCTLIRPDNGPKYLPSGQAATYLQVIFADATQYDAALESTNALGFRLANPCYEQARAQGKKPTWNPMSQSESFSKTRTLLLATTQFNAITWSSQLSAISGVVKVVTSFKATC